MIKTDNFFVISNFNTDPECLTKYCNDYFIYDQSDNEVNKLTLKDKYRKISFVENSGHSITNYFRYFIENYGNLPNYMALVKANMLERHISKDYFDKVYNNSFFTPLYSDRSWIDKPGIAYQIYEGGFLELNNNWYAGKRPHRYFKNYNQMLSFIFLNPIIPNWILFSPGACYIVTKEQVLNYPRVFYENLKYIVSYSYFPSEAYHMERMLGLIFNGYYELQPYMKDRTAFKKELAKYEFSDIQSVKDELFIYTLLRLCKKSLKSRYHLLLCKLLSKT